MNNFVFSIPTTAYFGKGQIKVLGAAINGHGGSKVLLAYGGGSIKSNGIYAAIIEQLQKAGLQHVDLSGIKPNPRVESVEEGIRLYRENRCDFILAVGGGSILDASKAIAAGVMYDGPVTDLFVDASGLSPITAAAPLATILTMAGTGSLYWNFGVGCLKGEALNDEEGLRNMNHLGQVIDWLGKAIGASGTPFPKISIELH